MKALVLAIIPLLATSVSSFAALLVNYDFGNSDNLPSSVDPNLTASNFTPTGSIGVPSRPVIYPGWAAAPSSEVVGSGTAAGTETDAVAGADYFSFTVTPTTGYALNLTNLSFGTAFYTASGGTVALSGAFFVRSSIDNFSTTISSIFPESHVTSANPDFNAREVDLTGSQFQDLTAPVTFRIYIFDSSNSSTRYLSIDDVTLTGETTVVPEPSMLGLLLAGSPLGLRRRRRASDAGV